MGAAWMGAWRGWAQVPGADLRPVRHVQHRGDAAHGQRGPRRPGPGQLLPLPAASLRAQRGRCVRCRGGHPRCRRSFLCRHSFLCHRCRRRRCCRRRCRRSVRMLLPRTLSWCHTLLPRMLLPHAVAARVVLRRARPLRTRTRSTPRSLARWPLCVRVGNIHLRSIILLLRVRVCGPAGRGLTDTDNALCGDFYQYFTADNKTDASVEAVIASIRAYHAQHRGGGGAAPK